MIASISPCQSEAESEHQRLPIEVISALYKLERFLVIQIIDAKNKLVEDRTVGIFIAGFTLNTYTYITNNMQKVRLKKSEAALNSPRQPHPRSLPTRQAELV